MTELGPNARNLIELARHEDDPDLAARERLQQALLIRLDTGVIAADKPTEVEFADRSGLRFQAAKSLVGSKAVLVLAAVVAAAGAGKMLSSRNTAAVATGAPRAASVPALTQPADAPDRLEQPQAGTARATPARRGVDKSSVDLDTVRVPGERGAGPAQGATASGSAQGATASGKLEPSLPAASDPRERAPSRRESSGAVATGRSAPDAASTAKFDPDDVADLAPSVGSKAKPAAPPAEELLAEARALREVQQVLRAGNSAQALSLLAAQERQFAHGQLGEARAAARAMALCANPSTEARQNSITVFEARWPRSILLPSVRAACASSKQ